MIPAQRMEVELYGIIEVELSQQPEGLGLRNPRGLRGRELEEPDMTPEVSAGWPESYLGDSSTAFSSVVPHLGPSYILYLGPSYTIRSDYMAI